MAPRPRLLLLALSLLPAALLGQEPVSIAKDMAISANAWLDSLTATQRQQAVFAVAHTERENWHYVPRSRRGVSLGQMNDGQREAARQLLAAGLSGRGCLQVEAIIALENVLRVVEESTRRDPQLYFFTVFGVPGSDGPWGWRVEGHHLSINFTLAAGRISATPQFFGANPAEVRIPHEQTGRRTMPQEEDLGRALAASFTPEQRRVGFISERAPADIFTGNDRQVTAGTPAGLPYARMTSPQQASLRDLVAVYAGRLRAETAQDELARIAAGGWDAVHFAWAGSLSPGEGHYYRIQGPAFLIEYDNTQDRANHIHTVWRSFAGDFGRDLLRDHYQEGHSARR